MLKRITTLLLLTGVLMFPATARGDYNGPSRGPNKFNTAYLRVHNAVDDAVKLSGVPGNSVLEPLETREFSYYLWSEQSATVQITASLVSDSSVTATIDVKLQKDKTTDVTVIYSDGTLSIQAERPAKQGTGKK